MEETIKQLIKLGQDNSEVAAKLTESVRKISDTQTQILRLLECLTKDYCSRISVFGNDSESEIFSQLMKCSQIEESQKDFLRKV